MSEVNATEQRILEAAEREFLAKGYAGARTTAIASAAGVTHAMLHYYFRTKEKLFSRVITKKIDGLAYIFSVPFDNREKSLEECLREGIAAHFDFVKENADLPRFMIGEVFKNSDLMDTMCERLHAISDNVFGSLQRKIDAEVACGKVSDIDARQLIIDIISLNIFAVISAPLMSRIMQIPMEETMEMRKQENINTIICKINSKI